MYLPIWFQIGETADLFNRAIVYLIVDKKIIDSFTYFLNGVFSTHLNLKKDTTTTSMTISNKREVPQGWSA